MGGGADRDHRDHCVVQIRLAQTRLTDVEINETGEAVYNLNVTLIRLAPPEKRT